MSSPLDDFTLKVAMGEAAVVEKRIQILLRPKPWWMPSRLWLALIRRMLVIAEQQQ